nr:YbhN family protein [Corynebacterium capitovis]
MIKQQGRSWVRWLAPLIALCVALLLFREKLPFLGGAWRALLSAAPGPVLASVATALLAILAMASVMQVLMNAEGRIVGIGPCLALTLSSNAWSTTIPGGPAIAAWLTFRVHRSWGASPGLCGWFIVISGALSTVWLVVVGVASIVFLGAHLSVWSLLTSLAIALGSAGAVLWAALHPGPLRSLASRAPARFRGSLLKLVDQVAAIRPPAYTYVLAATGSLLNLLIDVVTLYLAVWAVTSSPPGLSPAPDHTTVAGVTLAYLMTKLAGTAQVTPGGLGTVEAAAAGTLVAAGMTLVDATAAALIYRLVSFALITTCGWVVYGVRYAGQGFLLGRPSYDS